MRPSSIFSTKSGGINRFCWLWYLFLERSDGSYPTIRLTQASFSSFSPLISLLFPGLSPKSEAAQNICFNLAANLLGLGAAAAPAGIQAVCQLQQNTLDPTCACDHSILLILLNTASLQLIPTTAAMLRLQAGSASPMEILPAVWLSSVLSVLTGIAAAKGMASLCALPQRQKRRKMA